MGGELALVVSGASGAELARRFAELALEAGVEGLHLVLSGPAGQVAAHELGPGWSTARRFAESLGDARVRPWGEEDLLAPIASGSRRLAGVVVLPCSAGMAGALAAGISRGLGQRVADVALKQRWPLVLGVRETPMSPVLLENLLRLARAGAHVVPPLPAFYLRPDPEEAYRRFVDHYCFRILDLLGLAEPPEELRWNG